MLRHAGLSTQRIIILCIGENQRQLESFSKRFPTITCILGAVLEERIEEEPFVKCFSDVS